MKQRGLTFAAPGGNTAGGVLGVAFDYRMSGNFTSARQLTSENARANVMRGLTAHVTSLHGPQVIPAFVLESTGLAGQARHDDARARRRAAPACKST